MHSDLFVIELWQVTPTTDIGLGIVLQVSGPLCTAKVVLSRWRTRTRNLLRRLGIGEEVNYDVSVLFRNISYNANVWQYLGGDPKWLYFVVTDTDSGWYGKVFRIESVIPSHSRMSQFQYHTVALGKEMEADKVYYESGTLRAKS